jgi:hypothetical protein
MFGEMKDKIKNATDKAKQGADSLKEGAGDLLNKVMASSMSEIEGLRPVLNQSGFIIGDIIIEMALNPKINIVVEQVEEGELSIKDALKQEGLTKMQTSILKSIDKINELNTVVKQYEHTIGQIEIELGLPPTIKAHLNSLKSRAFSTGSQISEQPLSIEAD